MTDGQTILLAIETYPFVSLSDLSSNETEGNLLLFNGMHFATSIFLVSTGAGGEEDEGSWTGGVDTCGTTSFWIPTESSCRTGTGEEHGYGVIMISNGILVVVAIAR